MTGFGRSECETTPLTPFRKIFASHSGGNGEVLYLTGNSYDLEVLLSCTHRYLWCTRNYPVWKTITPPTGKRTVRTAAFSRRLRTRKIGQMTSPDLKWCVRGPSMRMSATLPKPASTGLVLPRKKDVIRAVGRPRLDSRRYVLFRWVAPASFPEVR